MRVGAENSSPFVAACAALERDVARGPAWLTPVRNAAMARFMERGLPTVLDEDWRYTNLAPLARTAFRRAEADTNDVAPAQLAPFLLEEAAAVLVFVNGRYAPRLSRRTPTPGVQVASLATLLRETPDVLEPQLARHADHHAQALVALNTALFADGAYVAIAPQSVIMQPIHLLYVKQPGAKPAASHPRSLVVAGAHSQATIVESYVGLGTGVSLTNAVTEIVADESAVVDHYKVQRELETAYHLGTLQIHQQRATQVASHCLSFGGALVRHDIRTVLAGQGGDCTLNGLFNVHADQHVDNALRVEHAAPHCNSREFFRGILDGRGRGAFTGRIVVRPAAQRTDAKQTNMNLLLSDEAQIDTKPQLEILANDVKCTHGATIGQLDADALFYLQTRGIAAPAARSLLTYAFAAESLAQIKIESLRRQLHAVLVARLPGGDAFRELA